MPRLSILRPNTRQFQDVVTQSLDAGATIVRDLTADPWRYFGSYLTFDYSAETHRPYDRYPLIMFADYNDETKTLVGYNFHHLPIHKRLWLMESMVGNLAAILKGWRDEGDRASEVKKQQLKSAAMEDYMRMIVSWKEMGQYYTACTRQYKIKNIKSEIIKFDGSSELLADVMVVPYEKIYNGSRRQILEKSKSIYMKEARGY